MKADVVRAEGAPGPTLVLAGDRLPQGALALGEELRNVRRWLDRTGRGHIRKIALYGASSSSAFDLEYRFVQSLPRGFDFRTGCGHSLLACVAAAGRAGPVRVRALTTGDAVVCEPEPQGTRTVRFTGPWAARRLLPTGCPVDRIGGFDVSLVRFGNPYVFVDASAFGVRTAEELFGAGVELLLPLLRVRAAAARLLGLAPRSALPKIAAIGADGSGRPFVRSVAVDGWHPSLALTGAACLTAAVAVPGTVPHRLADGSALTILTPGGAVRTTAVAKAGVLGSVAVHGKRAHILERSVRLPWRIRVTA
ncbi:2-methylaconitate cis-trans isomerase PrpF family protein [Streptomyces peucetius]|uniref:2-methylaconitate cis-trans isomerase PrpF family protein n=1 Tax=Streptomyces peucetius TaxID=1950 RepID=A0ABY6I3Y9_STRPE|nr:2-methylaconitate cis-trans isomerase PrpF family protein [Streptomyces peucetius]UYQ60602.1 2-methylaconitate cis-trans isomerase PrpF family protein [Streptomyces peucetius]